VAAPGGAPGFDFACALLYAGDLVLLRFAVGPQARGPALTCEF